MTVRLITQRYRNGAVLVAAIAACILNGACFEIYRPPAVRPVAYPVRQTTTLVRPITVIHDISVHGVLMTANRSRLLLVSDEAFYVIEVPPVIQRLLSPNRVGVTLDFGQLSVFSSDVAVQMTWQIPVSSLGAEDMIALSSHGLKASNGAWSVRIGGKGKKYQILSQLLSEVDAQPFAQGFSMHVSEFKDDHTIANMPLPLRISHGLGWWEGQMLVPLNLPVTGR